VKKNNWLKYNHHGLNWFDGDIEYDQCDDILRNKLNVYSVIYTKGNEKVQYLKNLLFVAVIDLALFNCPSLASLRLPFNRYESGLPFSANNVECLRKWLLR
jgi:hypothetical protein